MRYIVKRAAAGAVLGGSLFAIGGIGVANAAPPVNLQDGLVNVDVGNVTVAKDVNATVAAQVVAALCGTNVGGVDVNALANQVDQNGNAQTIANCTLPGGHVSVTQHARELASARADERTWAERNGAWPEQQRARSE